MNTSKILSLFDAILERKASRWALVAIVPGLFIWLLDVPLLKMINPLSPIEPLDKFFNVYTDLCGFIVGIPLLLLVFSFLAEILAKKGSWCYGGVTGLFWVGFLFRASYAGTTEKLVGLIVVPLVLFLGWRISKWETAWMPLARRVALAAGISIALGGGFITKEMKETFQRPRPLNTENGLQERLRGFEEEPLTGHSSFPSGHSSSAWSMCFPIFLVLRRRKRKEQYAFLVIPFLNSLSRVYLAVHFPIDVYVGAWLGIVSGYIAVGAVFGEDESLGTRQTSLDPGSSSLGGENGDDEALDQARDEV